MRRGHGRTGPTGSTGPFATEGTSRERVRSEVTPPARTIIGTDSVDHRAGGRLRRAGDPGGSGRTTRPTGTDPTRRGNEPTPHFCGSCQSWAVGRVEIRSVGAVVCGTGTVALAPRARRPPPPAARRRATDPGSGSPAQVVSPPSRPAVPPPRCPTHPCPADGARRPRPGRLGCRRPLGPTPTDTEGRPSPTGRVTGRSEKKRSASR